MKKQYLSILLIIAMLVVLVAGCSNESNETEENTSGNVTIEMVSTIVSENPEGGLEQAAIAKWTEKTGNQMKLVSINRNDAIKTLLAMANTGDMPDIITLDNALVGELVQMELLANLNDVYGKEYVDGFDSDVLELCKYEGEVYGVPYFQQLFGLLYRADWFESENIKVPTTWEEFVDAAKKLTKDTDGDGTVDRWGVAMVGTNNGSGWGRFFPIHATFGVEALYEKDGKWVSDAGTEQAKNAMKFFTDLVVEHSVVPVGPLETAYKEAIALMGSSKTGMMITGTHSLGAIVAASGGELAGDELSVTALPVDPATNKVISTVSAQILGFNAKSKNLDVAADYLKFWNEEENALDFLSKTGRMPVRTDVIAKANALPAMEEIMNAEFDEFYVAAQIPAVIDIHTAYGEAWQSIITESKSLDEAMEELTSKVDGIISTIDT